MFCNLTAVASLSALELLPRLACTARHSQQRVDTWLGKYGVARSGNAFGVPRRATWRVHRSDSHNEVVKARASAPREWLCESNVTIGTSFASSRPLFRRYDMGRRTFTSQCTFTFFPPSFRLAEQIRKKRSGPSTDFPPGGTLAEPRRSKVISAQSRCHTKNGKRRGRGAGTRSLFWHLPTTKAVAARTRGGHVIGGVAHGGFCV